MRNDIDYNDLITMDDNTFDVFVTLTLDNE